MVGRDSFLVGGHRVIDYEYIRERVMMKEMPQLIVVKGDSISIERANDHIYHNIERSLYHSQEVKAISEGFKLFNGPLNVIPTL